MRLPTSHFVLGMLVGAGLLGTGMLLGGADQVQPPAAATSVADVVQARRFEVVDELGTVLLVIGSNKDGGSISVRDRFGKTVLLASAAEHGGTLVATHRTGQSAFVAGATDRGASATLMIRGGVPGVEMTASPDGSVMAIGSPSGRTGLTLKSTDDDGGTIAVHNDAGGICSRFFSNVSGGGVIETYRANGDPLVAISSTEAGHGQINTYFGIGNSLISLTATANHEGNIYTYNAEHLPLAAIASSPEGPSLRIFNKHGEPIVTLESDVDGNGEIGAWRRDGTGRTFTP